MEISYYEDLEERTFKLAQRVRTWIKKLPDTIANTEDIRQLARSTGSVAANYIEANESLSRKDFLMRVEISRKESEESKMWLRLIETGSEEQDKERLSLIQESIEFIKIFSSIITKCTKSV